MKKFFISLEERFVFPIGRRTWQILALLALLGLAAFAVWFIINMTPTGRANVNVSKSEVVSNKIDTSRATESKPAEGCPQKDYDAYIDSLKQDLPNAEWNSLGDSTEPYSAYLTDEYGNYVTDDFGSYVIIQKRDYRENPGAIPNILNRVFSMRGLDTSLLCERIEVLKCLHVLSAITQNALLMEDGFYRYCELVAGNNDVNSSLLNKSIGLKSKIDGASLQINKKDDINSIIKYINYVNSKNISDEEIEACLGLLDAHRKITNPTFNRKDYFDIAEIVFESSLEIKELNNALGGFKDDIEYYDRNKLDKSLDRYLHLYAEKLSIAEMEKRAKEMKKVTNRSLSLLAMAICFASVISIATILLLYSIQNLLKEYTGRKEK